MFRLNRWTVWIGLAVGTAASGSAERRYVDASAQGTPPDGESWEFAYRTVQAALADAEATEIWVANGTYKPTDGTSRSATFLIPSNRRVYGGFRGIDGSFPGETSLSERDEASNETILDGDINTSASTDNCYHVVTITDSSYLSTKLSGFTIRNGYADGSGDDSRGAGILIIGDADDYTLDRLKIKNNYASGGGGGVCVQGTFQLYMANCRFESNSAAGGTGAGCCLSLILDS